MIERKVAAVAEVELTRGAKGEYRWVVKSAATRPSVAVADAVGMDRLLRQQYYPDEIEPFKKQIIEEETGGE